MGTVFKYIGGVLAALGLIIVMALIMAYPTMWLWNWLMPTLSYIISILYLLFLIILSSLLFKN